MSPRVRPVLLEAMVVAGAVFVIHRFFSLGEAYLVGSFNDDGVYTVLGKALAAGKGYTSMHLVGAPVQVKYPPGWPAVLAVLWGVTGSVAGVLQAVQWLNPLALAVTAGLIWLIARDQWHAELGPVLLLVVTPMLLEPVIQYTAIPLVEPWFMLAWALALFVWYNPGLARRIGGTWALLLSALLVAVAVLFRTQAVVLVLAFLVALWRRKTAKRESLLACAALLLPLLMWGLYHHALVARGPTADLPDERPYTAWVLTGGVGVWRTLLQSVWGNLRFYTLFTGGLVTSPGILGTTVVVLTLGATLVAGLALARNEPFLALGTLGNLALVLVWPYSQDRLLLSSLPVGGLLLSIATAPALKGASVAMRRWVNIGAAVGVAVVLFRQADLHRDVLAAEEEHHRPRMYTAGYAILENSRFIATAGPWILEHTRPSDRVMIDWPAGIYLYTGRQTVPANPSESRLALSVFTAPGRYLASHILQDSLSWVIVGASNAGITRDIATLQARCPSVLTQGPAESRLIVFQVTPDPGCLRPIAGD